MLVMIWGTAALNHDHESGGTMGTRMPGGMLLAGAMGPVRVAGGPFPAITGRAAFPQVEIQSQEPLIPPSRIWPSQRQRSGFYEALLPNRDF